MTRNKISECIRFAAAAILCIAVSVPAGDSWVTSLPTLPPDSGYGAQGPLETHIDSLPNPQWKHHQVYFYHPRFERKKYPTILFCHGIGAERPCVYGELLKHMVSWGYAVLYAPYDKSGAIQSPTDAYAMMWSGFVLGFRAFAADIDTSRIGIVGHSFGGGAAPAIAWKALHEKHWGGCGAFIYIMAPWYAYDITDEQLKKFAPTIALVMETFEDDKTNDPRMAIDIFRSMAIPDSQKDFITLKSDTDEGALLLAGHDVPEGAYAFGWNVNALDYFGVYRLIHALAALIFDNDSRARTIALGGGGASQRFMGAWQSGKPVKELSSCKAPTAAKPQCSYVNFWTHAANPRAHSRRYFQSEDTSSINTATTIMNYRSAAVFRKKNIGLDQSEQLQSQALAENRGMKDFADDHGDPENHTDTALPPASARAGKKSVFDPPQSGFGAKGPYFVRENTYPHPSGASGDLYCCMPQGIRKKIPVVLFAPELLASGGKYKELLRHIASRGYAVVSSTYRYGLFVNDVERYSALMEGFDGVLELIKPLIDTARIGFVGHSYGAGALPAVAWHYRKELGWGSGGAFCFLMGPSYVHCMRQIQFEQFPSDVKLLIEVYENDHWNDFRIAEDVFYAINIHPADKDFIIVNKSKHGEWEINPDYQSPFCEDSSKLGPVQRHAVFRLVDALAAYAFDGDACGRDAALGNGCPRQTSMGHWPDGARVLPLTSTDVPIARNRLWPHALTATGFPRLVNWFLPFPFSCDFDDDRNERREFLTP